MPLNQFSMDQSLDCISVLNRIPKLNNDKPPYEVLTGLQPDHLRDFHVKWGEPVVVEKAKGISSDLSVTGQWGVVVSSIINGGSWRSILLETRKYAYHFYSTTMCVGEFERPEQLNDKS